MADISWLTARPIAHRGFHDNSAGRWENTLSAFEAATSAGYGIECDVHLSKDGVPVILHDDELKRLTGIDGHVYDKTAAELAALRIGGSSDHIPTLRETLDRVAGRVPLLIELKGVEGKDEGVVAKVAELLSGYPGKAALMSFAHWLVREFPVYAPGIPGGLTASGTARDDIERHFSMLAYDLSFVSYALGDMPNPFTRFVRERLAMPVITWTILDQVAADLTFAHGDQMTFEGFVPKQATAIA